METTSPSRSWGCTGTWSISSGSSCSRCCTSWAAGPGCIIRCTMANKEPLAERMTHQHVEDVGSHGEHHIVPVPVYLWVFAALMVLLIVTVAAARVDMGSMNIVVAMTIAVVKAALVVLYFMHV